MTFGTCDRHPKRRLFPHPLNDIERLKKTLILLLLFVIVTGRGPLGVCVYFGGYLFSERQCVSHQFKPDVTTTSINPFSKVLLNLINHTNKAIAKIIQNCLFYLVGLLLKWKATFRIPKIPCPICPISALRGTFCRKLSAFF